MYSLDSEVPLLGMGGKKKEGQRSNPQLVPLVGFGDEMDKLEEEGHGDLFKERKGSDPDLFARERTVRRGNIRVEEGSR